MQDSSPETPGPVGPAPSVEDLAREVAALREQLGAVGRTVADHEDRMAALEVAVVDGREGIERAVMEMGEILRADFRELIRSGIDAINGIALEMQKRDRERDKREAALVSLCEETLVAVRAAIPAAALVPPGGTT